jgi:hypothetical protein
MFIDSDALQICKAPQGRNVQFVFEDRDQDIALLRSYGNIQLLYSHESDPDEFAKSTSIGTYENSDRVREPLII